MKKRNIFNLKKYAAEPQIGIFWVYKGQILQFSEPVGNIPPIAGFKDSNFTHDAYWDQVQKMYSELADKEYFDVPRGRVLFVVNGIYKIILSSQLASNKILINRIIVNFSLPQNKTIIERDIHYDAYSDMDFEDENNDDIVNE